MTLVDTSVWVDHYRYGNEALRALIGGDRVLCHPFVIGEIAMGSLKHREVTLQALQLLPLAMPARDEEVMLLIGSHTLHSKGLSYVDAHLLASALITADCRLWSYDKRLHKTALEMDIASTLGTTH